MKLDTRNRLRAILSGALQSTATEKQEASERWNHYKKTKNEQKKRRYQRQRQLQIELGLAKPPTYSRVSWETLYRRAAGKEGSLEEQEHARQRVSIRKTRQREYARRTQGHAKAVYNNKQELVAGRPRPLICEVCNEPNQYKRSTIHFDHDHATGAFRGWLCVRCNHTLGKVKDSPELLLKLAAYLQSPPGPTINC